jgi:hypothetical protein
MSSQELILSTKHYDSGRKAYVYKFPQQQHFKQNQWQVACTQANWFSSFFNVDAALYQNASIQLQFPSGESEWVSVDYVIPDGHYTSSAFSALLSKISYEQGYYTQSGSITTRYIDLSHSAYQYANALTLYPVPVGSSPPANGMWVTLTGAARSPKVYFSSALGSLFGYSQNWYGDGGSVQQSIVSNIVPQVDQVSSVVLTCSLIQNQGISNPHDFLYAQSLGGVDFGDMVQSPAHAPLYNSVAAGSVSEVVIRLFDQDLQPVTLRDPSAMFQLSFVLKQ